MTFGIAAVLLVIAVIALVLCCKFIKKRALRIGIVVFLSAAVLALAVYMGLTLIFVDAIQNQPLAA